MESTTDLALTEQHLTVPQLREHVNLVGNAMKDVMQPDVHYGAIPGTDKLVLLKAGAEKLLLLFHLDPEYEAVTTYDGPHLTVVTICTLYHFTTGQRVGSGMGLCTTKEVKYAYRKSARHCPDCGKETIIQGKKEYGGGFICWQKKGGCGSKFAENDPRITSQPEGRVDNEELPDTYNTVLKMSNKRALVAAVLNVTAASDIFTQDVEEFVEPSTGEIVAGKAPEQKQAPTQTAKREPVKQEPVKQETRKGYKASELDIGNPEHAGSIDKALGLFGCTLQHAESKRDGKTYKNVLVLGHIELIPMPVWDASVNKSGGRNGSLGFVNDRDKNLGKHLSFNAKSFNPFIRALASWWLNNPNERPDLTKLEAPASGEGEWQ